MELEVNVAFHDKLALINDRLQSFVPAIQTPYQNLFNAARYALSAPGKRMRPLLTLLTAEMLGGSVNAALNPACAIELIHTYSMIHDDLPCMDDDDYRRGMPTLHKAFPEATALLTGDFLLTFAFQVLAEAPEISEKGKLEMIALLARRSGGEGMIGGQIMDLEAENREVSFDFLQTIHQKKTGELISASVEFGAIVAKAPGEIRYKLQEFGRLIGLAFQVIDDILDVSEPNAKHGKAISSDVVKKKTTAITLLGIERSKKMAQELIEEAESLLSSFDTDSSQLKKVTRYFLARKR